MTHDATARAELDPTLMRVAALRFNDTQAVDSVLRTVVRELQSRGVRVAGALQVKCGTDRRRSDMVLAGIGTGERFVISQSLGRGARGCRLDPRLLANAAASIAPRIAISDLLVLNRFGRGEAEGHGFRDLFVRALEADVPVLTAVRDIYAEPWDEFVGEAIDLPPDVASALRWVTAHLNDRARPGGEDAEADGAAVEAPSDGAGADTAFDAAQGLHKRAI